MSGGGFFVYLNKCIIMQAKAKSAIAQVIYILHNNSAEQHHQ